MAFILKDATYINWKTLEFIQTHILVNEGLNGRIQFIDKIENTANYDQIIDCKGKYVTKAFAVGHHHVYSALARGMPAPKKTPDNFPEILKYIWWNLDKALDKESIRASALATAMACAKAGSTFVIDHHASPNYIDGSLDIIAEAFEEIGISHLLCYEISDRDGQECISGGLDETARYLHENQGLVGLHASFTVSNKTMKSAAELMSKFGSGIHIHVAEDVYDQQQCYDKYGKRVVERLADFGILDSGKSILGHCLHLDDHERSLLSKSKCWVVENMESNLKNNVGYFKGEGLGDNIMLGTDGMHSNMIRSAQAAYFAGKRYDDIDFGDAYRRFRNVHKYLDQNNIKGDSENNLVILDYPTPTPLNQNNFLGHFIFGFSANFINDVISNGKLIVKDKVLLTVNENDTLKFVREQAEKLWGRMN
jgi:cytosine/adenosine deaminase-related metal-dependent hydrolase